MTTSNGELIIGTHLYPLRYFGDMYRHWPDGISPKTVEVIRTIRIDQHDILVTRGGGLFVRPPELPEQGNEAVDARLAFKEEAARLFNILICELCLAGLNSEPASSAVIEVGELRDGRAVITTAGSSGDIHYDRTIEARTNIWGRSACPDSVLEFAEPLVRSRLLAKISEAIPTLVAGGYYQYSRRHFPEALVDSFVVTEQILDYLWAQYVAGLTETDEPGTTRDEKRKARLKDNRTYTASVRAEVLLTAGRISVEYYNLFHKARKHRNEAAHRAKISSDAAAVCTKSMKASIRTRLPIRGR